MLIVVVGVRCRLLGVELSVVLMFGMKCSVPVTGVCSGGMCFDWWNGSRQPWSTCAQLTDVF